MMDPRRSHGSFTIHRRHPTISDLKVRAAEIVDHARRNHRPVLLTRRGRGVAVLLDVEDYQSLADRVAFLDAVEAGARSAKGTGDES